MTPPLPWQSRLEMDVLQFRRWGGSWRLLNRCRIMVRASGLLYGGMYWLGVPAQQHYRYGEECEMSTSIRPKWNFGITGQAPPARPCNAQAMARLHAQYAVYREEGMGRRVAPWTREAALTLGRLFIAAHARIPPASYLQCSYSMPEESSIRRIFGTLQGYRDALSKEDAL